MAQAAAREEALPAEIARLLAAREAAARDEAEANAAMTKALEPVTEAERKLAEAEAAYAAAWK
jgi:hypothetical protein